MSSHSSDSAGPVRLRRSCVACTNARTRCSGGEMLGATRLPCARCNQQGIRCVYLALRKPGPKTGDSASRRADTRTLLLNDVVPDAPSRVDAAWASASDGSSASDSVPGQSPQVIDRTASLDFGQFARALFPHGANGVFASADPSRIAPDSRSGTFAPASRPDSFQRPVPFYGEFLVPDDVYSFLLHRYWTHFYHSTPAIVRRGIMNRVGRLQMFVNDACCFHTAFYLNSDDTFRFVPVFFERVKRGLVPAIERILGGQDMLSLPDYAVMSNGTRQLSIFVVFSLISIISVCMAEKATSDDPLGDAHALLTLAVRVARIAGMNAEWRFGRPETGKATPLLEMCRRCWWALFSIDRHISVLFGRAPLIHPDESEVAFPLSDADYEGLAKPEQENDALDLLLTESVTVSRPRGSKPPKIPWLTAPDKVTGSLGALPFGLVEYYVALMSLYERVRWYRALSLQANMPPWADTTARRFIVADLDTWFDGLPPFIEQYDGNPQLVVRGPNSGEMAAFAIGYRLVMFHTLYVLICSPHDILAPEPGFNDSDAFILAHEHALRTTAWLKVLLTIPSNPVFNTGLFQFCVLKTGLIHLAFVRSLGRKETGSALAIEALEHVHIHTSAFIAGQRKYKWRITGDGQEGSGGPGQLTFWYRSWLQALAAPQFGAV